MKVGYLVASGNGCGKRYFYIKKEDALKDKHRHWNIHKVLEESKDCYQILEEIKR